MKKIVSLLLALVMLVGVFAVAAAAEANDNWKVAILTGTVSQGEEEFRAAEKAVATWGAEHIICLLYTSDAADE